MDGGQTVTVGRHGKPTILTLLPPARDPHGHVVFRFGEFAVSTGRRIVLREGVEVPLIPRYFDLLVLLIRRRHEAVSRRDIMDAAWSDVVVSDGALTQAVRSLRRALGDDPREPAFIRTVSRHGYQFVVSRRAREGGRGAGGGARAGQLGGGRAARRTAIPSKQALERLLTVRGAGEEAEAARREAAEALHASAPRRRCDGWTAGPATRRRAPCCATRAGTFPARGRCRSWASPAASRAAGILIALRLRRAVRIASRRWGAASGGAVRWPGAWGGALGGLAFCSAPAPGRARR